MENRFPPVMQWRGLLEETLTSSFLMCSSNMELLWIEFSSALSHMRKRVQTCIGVAYKKIHSKTCNMCSDIIEADM